MKHSLHSETNNFFKSIQVELTELETMLTEEIPPLSGPLNEMLRFILGGKGKRLRPGLALLAAKMTSSDGIIRKEHLVLACLTELIHTASLVHDDVIDEASSRRGQESTHLKWGGKIAVICGDFLFAQASVQLGELANTEIVKIYADVLAKLCIGEIAQAQNRFNLQTADWESYFDKSFSKTASLFAAATKSASILNKQSDLITENLYEYGKNLGMAFQIIDDLLDFTSSSAQLGKPIMGDLSQGILTAPVIFALEDKSCRSKLEKLIGSQLSKDISDLEEVKKVLEASGAFDKTYELAKSYADKSLSSLNKLPDGECKEDLKQLLHFTLSRLS